MQENVLLEIKIKRNILEKDLEQKNTTEKLM